MAINFEYIKRFIILIGAILTYFLITEFNKAKITIPTYHTIGFILPPADTSDCSLIGLEWTNREGKVWNGTSWE
jgi:hypothetical protein